MKTLNHAPSASFGTKSGRRRAFERCYMGGMSVDTAWPTIMPIRSGLAHTGCLRRSQISVIRRPTRGLFRFGTECWTVGSTRKRFKNASAPRRRLPSRTEVCLSYRVVQDVARRSKAMPYSRWWPWDLWTTGAAVWPTVSSVGSGRTVDGTATAGLGPRPPLFGSHSFHFGACHCMPRQPAALRRAMRRSMRRRSSLSANCSDGAEMVK